MQPKRNTDTKVQVWYRTDRIFEHNKEWYFHTREKTIEGPFQSQRDSLEQLEMYINLKDTGIAYNYI